MPHDFFLRNAQAESAVKVVYFRGSITSVRILYNCWVTLEECVYAQSVGLGLLRLSPLHRALFPTYLLRPSPHSVKSIPTKPPAFDTQFVGRLSSFLRRPGQVSITSRFGIAFQPYFGCVISQSSSSPVFIMLIHLFFTSRVGVILPSFWII